MLDKNRHASIAEMAEAERLDHAKIYAAGEPVGGSWTC
jgi:hypothetical protein